MTMSLPAAMLLCSAFEPPHSSNSSPVAYNPWQRKGLFDLKWNV